LREAVAALGEAPPAVPPVEHTVAAAELIERALRSPLFDGLFHPERVALLAARLAGVATPEWVSRSPIEGEEADRIRWLNLAALGLFVLHNEPNVLASTGLPESPPAMGPEGAPRQPSLTGVRVHDGSSGRSR
jgi:hypothetical protein